MKFAVTGGAGFVGSNIVHKLLKNGYDVCVIDNLHTGKIENIKDVFDGLEFFQIDIRNIDKLDEVLRGVDGVFHEAALTIVQESFLKQEEYHDVNVVGTENVFKIAKKHGIKVVYASTSSVYGDVDKIPIKEDSPRNPINPYGMTKLKGEHLAERYARDGLEVLGLRYFNIFGKGQTGTYAGVITQFMNRLNEKKPPVIYGDGMQIRDFVFVEDVAESNLKAMQSSVKNGFFNIGTGKATSIKELAEIMINLWGFSFEPSFSPPLEGDIKQSQADITLTRNLLSWESKTSLKDGLAKMIR
jgi:UDP-glucose 4-epimerase